MTSFQDREQGFDSHFALEAEQEFRAMARRDRMIGAWAAGLMGLEGDAAQDYAASIVREDLKDPGDEDVFRKLHNDLTAAGVAVTDAEIRSEMDRLLAVAREQIKAGE